MQATYSDAGSSGSEDTGKEGSPLRREYPTDKMANSEILSPLSKVRLLQVLLRTYSAGSSNVQCL